MRCSTTLSLDGAIREINNMNNVPIVTYHFHIHLSICTLLMSLVLINKSKNLLISNY